MFGRRGAFCLITITLFSALSAHALDFALRFMPEASMPMPGESAELFSVGGGGVLSADMELFGFLSPALEMGFLLAPAKNTGKNFLLANGGIDLSVFFYPIPRLKTRIGAGGGMYYGQYATAQTAFNYYWKARGEIGYRFIPSFSLLLGGEYTQYLYRGGTHYSGISIGLSADLNLGFLASRESGISLATTQTDAVFPILYTAYDHAPLGFAKITNSEQAEIRDVSVSFQIANYTSQPKLCARLPLLERGGSAEVPLYATFNERVLALAENTKVQAEIIVSYSLLDARMESKKAQTISFTHRNAATWKDPNIAAAFVSPNNPAVLEYSKYIAGLVRDRIRSGIDGNLQYGMGLFEGLRLGGVTYAADPSTPYKAYRKDPSRIDYLQYPGQTLSYKSGECDDLSILFAALLESVGIECAFLPFDDEFCVAFALDATEEEARAAFLDPSSLVFHEGKAWVPIRMSLIQEGFVAAWQGGARMWNDALTGGLSPPMNTLAAAWKTYQPVGVPDVESRIAKPTEEQIAVAFENAIHRFISAEIQPQVGKLVSQMSPPDGTPKQQNALGILYARYGLLKEAKGAFEKAAAANHLPALINMGNILFLEGRYEEAIGYFQRVLAVQPANTAALLGLARAKYELDQFSESDALIGKVRELNPELAAKYSYLASQISGAASRASSARDRGEMIWSTEE